MQRLNNTLLWGRTFGGSLNSKQRTLTPVWKYCYSKEEQKKEYISVFLIICKEMRSEMNKEKTLKPLSFSWQVSLCLKKIYQKWHSTQVNGVHSNKSFEIVRYFTAYKNWRNYYLYGANESYLEHVLIMIPLWKSCVSRMKNNERFDKIYLLKNVHTLTSKQWQQIRN